MIEARAAAERAARTAYGRLLALLAARAGDIAAAEDALAEALAASLATWPARGVPARPEAWLLVVARRALGHARARTATARAAAPTARLLADERAQTRDPATDPRLALMFVCAHPAIDPAVRAPLMLQTVLGLDAARIAAAFLIAPSAMARRLVRAKAKIRDARIPFAIPDPDQQADRLEPVLAAIYAAYGTGWEDLNGADPRRRGLCEEAIYLARLVAERPAAPPEALGLLALLLHAQARHPARRDEHGRFVPLARQDPARWQRAMAIEAEAHLRAAARAAVPGRFQIEAAIQSLHAQTIMSRVPAPAALIRLYDLLIEVAPSVGGAVARACAYAEGGDPAAALAQLDMLAERARDYQPWWAARARALHLAGFAEQARAAGERAAGLTSDPAVRAHLLGGGLFAGPETARIGPAPAPAISPM